MPAQWYPPDIATAGAVGHPAGSGTGTADPSSIRRTRPAPPSSSAGSSIRRVAVNAIPFAAWIIPLCPIPTPPVAVFAHEWPGTPSAKQVVRNWAVGVIHETSATSVEPDPSSPASRIGDGAASRPSLTISAGWCRFTRLLTRRFSGYWRGDGLAVGVVLLVERDRAEFLQDRRHLPRHHLVRQHVVGPGDEVLLQRRLGHHRRTLRHLPDPLGQLVDLMTAPASG